MSRQVCRETAPLFAGSAGDDDVDLRVRLEERADGLHGADDAGFADGSGSLVADMSERAVSGREQRTRSLKRLSAHGWHPAARG